MTLGQRNLFSDFIPEDQFVVRFCNSWYSECLPGVELGLRFQRGRQLLTVVMLSQENVTVSSK